MADATLAQALRDARQHLQMLSPSAELDAALLLCFVLQVPRSHVYTWPEQRLTPTQTEQFNALIGRRAKGEPVAYLTGRCEFWDIQLCVTPDVLIPRPETELLVQAALDHLPEHDSVLRVLDLGTGSGAIACALAHARPEWQVTAVDNSTAALLVAKKNVAQLQLKNVSCVQSNWFADLPPQSFDIIVSNPPYIDVADPNLEPEVRQFEPCAALFSKESGLADLRHLIASAPNFLAPQGGLFLEHGWQQSEQIRTFFSSANFHKIKTLVDLQGLERLTQGQVC